MDTLDQRVTRIENRLIKNQAGLGTMSTQDANAVAITGGSIVGITDLAVADGGTGASTAANARTNLGVTATGADATYNLRANNLSDVLTPATARTNLGLAIGSNVEAWDADLDALAALSATAGFLSRTGAAAFAQRTLQAGTGISISNPTGAAGDPTITCTVSAYTDGSTIKAADGASVGTPGITFNSDPDNGLYRLGTNNWAMAAGGAKIWEVSAAGEITLPLQPSFLARNSATDADVTGDGTEATVDFDTEVFDRNNDFASSTFTAPVTGIYWLATTFFLVQLSVLHTGGILKIVTSNRTYAIEFNAGAMRDSANQLALNMSQLADMDAADTAVVKITISGSTKTVDVFGGSGPDTNFCGMLAA